MAPITQICEVLELSRSAYYSWLDSEVTQRDEEDRILSPKVREVFMHHRRRYGSRRIAIELSETDAKCGRKRASRIMKMQGLRAIQPKSFKPRSTESKHRLGYNPNLLLSESANGIGQVWVGDITYIPCAECHYCYLAVLMDAFSRRIIGWHLSEDMTEELVLTSLRNAIAARQPSPGLIHHTDRGGQYASKEYRQILKRAAMRQSMSRADNCYDNAAMESCFGTIKNELEMTEYSTTREALKEVASYIEYYNVERRHSSLDYLSPVQFESTQR